MSAYTIPATVTALTLAILATFALGADGPTVAPTAPAGCFEDMECWVGTVNDDRSPVEQDAARATFGN